MYNLLTHNYYDCFESELIITGQLFACMCNEPYYIVDPLLIILSHVQHVTQNYTIIHVHVLHYVCTVLDINGHTTLFRTFPQKGGGTRIALIH